MPGGHQGDDVRPVSHGVKLTYDDFLLFPDDGQRHELIDGEHHVTPSPNVKHQRVQINLVRALLSYLDAHPVGEIFCAPLDVVLSQHDVVEPDMFYLSHERAAEVLTPQHARGAPELVIEIASKGTRKRDETIKRRLYERDGVSEYWVVDPEGQGDSRVPSRGQSLWSNHRAHQREGRCTDPPLLPGLEIELTRIFAEPGGTSRR